MASSATCASADHMEAMLELEERLYGVNHWDVRQKLTSAGKKHVHNLAEAIIFQALEDLWVSSEIKKSLNFFTSADFGLYAEAAGMSVPRQLKVLRLIERAGFSIASRKERCHE